MNRWANEPSRLAPKREEKLHGNERGPDDHADEANNVPPFRMGPSVPGDLRTLAPVDNPLSLIHI